MKKILLFSGMLLLNLAGIAQSKSPVGVWKTIDDKTSRAKSHIEIYEQKGKLYGKVIRLLEDDNDSICDLCPGDKKDKPVLGMIVMEGLKKEGDKYTGGSILDPETGKTYRCSIWLEQDNVLKVRGFIGISLLGRSQNWYRIK
jgi:uncharacterized protein (DUF2147 family)